MQQQVKTTPFAGIFSLLRGDMFYPAIPLIPRLLKDKGGQYDVPSTSPGRDLWSQGSARALGRREPQPHGTLAGEAEDINVPSAANCQARELKIGGSAFS